MQDLGTLGGEYSVAEGINNAGQVVGMSFSATGDERAFLFNGNTMIDLNTLIDPPSSGYTLEEARAINDNGQIVGYGYNYSTHQEDAYLLTPVPEPLTVVALAIGIACLGGYIRLRFRTALTLLPK
jgi:probable HAF family extracellular repeat protein